MDPVMPPPLALRKDNRHRTLVADLGTPGNRAADLRPHVDYLCLA